MKYISIVIIFCMFSMTSLNAKKSELSDILQKAGEKKVIVKPMPKKQQVRKESHFIFKDTYDANGIGMNHNKRVKNTGKSKSYDYKNKSRFKFKFTPGTDVSNIVAGQGSSAATSGGSGGGARMGGGGGQSRGGGRR